MYREKSAPSYNRMYLTRSLLRTGDSLIVDGAGFRPLWLRNWRGGLTGDAERWSHLLGDAPCC